MTRQFTAISNDSRSVIPGSIFLAYPGDAADGRQFISQAIQNGATKIIYDPSGQFVLPPLSVPAIPVENLRVKQSDIAAEFYDFPAKKLHVIGVTGTNGKTSITHFLSQIMSHCAVVGTMGYGVPPHLSKTNNTTPDGLQLQKIFSELLSSGARNIAMEVTSHALSQQRVHNIHFDTAIFTNLTQDHLDYHGTLAQYRDAKELLFQSPGLKNAIINIDDAAGKYFSEKYANRLNVITFSARDTNATVYVKNKKYVSSGFELSVHTPAGICIFVLPLLGEFNIENALAVLSVLWLQKWPLEKIAAAMSALKPVPGRIELLQLPAMPNVVIDYAHTPDALEKILQHVRAHATGKLWCIFGCGGNRDKTKRPKMGAIAEKLADHVMITNDNPRFEKDHVIADEVYAGIVDKNKCRIQLDRDAAIRDAIANADKNDWIVVAGKGHECEQIIGDRALPHNDKRSVFSAFRARLKKISTLAELVDGKLIGSDGACGDIVTDTRVANQGDCFVAIVGEVFDGHGFIFEAEKRKAAVAIVEKKCDTSISQIVVRNTREALLTIATFFRDTLDIPVLAVTGSCGKTTTRALLENITKQCGSVLASQKSFNNDIGVPLTLLRSSATDQFAVLEMGANHPGELSVLTRVVKPTAAVITITAPVHVEGFGSVDRIASAKAEIFEGLTRDGVAVINADDHYAQFWRDKNAHRSVITFGKKENADVMAKEIISDADGRTRFLLCASGQSISISLPLLGEHNVTNALAAASMAIAIHIPLSAIKVGLETAQAVEGRLIVKTGYANATIIDDSYNANPTAVCAAMQLLVHRNPAHNIFVLGDMLELGNEAESMHADAGRFAKSVGVKTLLCFGKLSFAAAAAFGEHAQHFDSQLTLIEKLKTLLNNKMTVLIKGSHGMRMDKVVAALL